MWKNGLRLMSVLAMMGALAYGYISSPGPLIKSQCKLVTNPYPYPPTCNVVTCTGVCSYVAGSDSCGCFI
jgi:hypothetical protein